MESLSQILADWGYWGLFFSAFIAGSILPFSSEAVMIVLVHMGLDPVLCVAAASLGNTLGGMSCYWIGTLGKSEWITRLGVSEKQLARARRFLAGRGALMAFFAFLPTIGRGHRHRAGADAQQRLAYGRLDARGQDPALYRRTGDLRRRRIAFLTWISKL